MCGHLVRGLAMHMEAYVGRKSEPEKTFLQRIKKFSSNSELKDNQDPLPSKEWFARQEEQYLEVYKLFLNPDYEPPENWIEMYYHVETIWVIYAFVFVKMKVLPIRVLILFDHALSLLAIATSIVVMKIKKKGGNLDQSGKGTSKIKQKSAKARQLVIEKYHGLSASFRQRNEGRPFVIAGEIKRTYPEKTGPSTRTIVRYLRKEVILS